MRTLLDRTLLIDDKEYEILFLDNNVDYFEETKYVTGGIIYRLKEKRKKRKDKKSHRAKK